MRWASILFASCALVTGLIAAVYWYRTSTVKIEPSFHKRLTISLDDQSLPWIAGIMNATSDAARLNKTAALWTCASVVFAGLSSIIGAFK
jgi:hypothetical protein